MNLNETHDPSRRSWLQSANHPDTDFPIQNLPLGIFREGGIARGGTAIGDRIFDLAAALDLGFLSGEAANAARAAAGDTLNPLMALGSRPASALRARLSDLLRADGPERRRVESHANRLLVPMSSAEMLLPAKIGNFTDFVCSTFHAQRAVRKPLDSPLAPVLTYMPVAYHGRASSIRVSGEDIRRSQGQFKDSEGVVLFGPSKALDFELEVGAFVSTGNPLGSSIPIESAAAHIFGYCLLNDWSARDIQFWESMLGPFLSKSLSTTISPWIVSPEALAPFRAAVFRPTQPDWPSPLAYLDSESDRAEGGIDIELEAHLSTSGMRESGESSGSHRHNEFQVRLLELRPNDRAPHQQRLQLAARRPPGQRDCIGSNGRQQGLPHGTYRAFSSAAWREPSVSGGRRRSHIQGARQPRRICPDRFRRMPRTNRGDLTRPRVHSLDQRFELPTLWLARTSNGQ